MNTLRRLAWLAVGAAYFQIVLGQVVRITGSGLGCGPNWPLCNGYLIPPLNDVPTLIEYGHRLSALALGFAMIALMGAAWMRRGSPETGPVRRAATLGLGLYIGIALLGAVTVFLDLSAWAVLPHLAAALGLLATLVVAAHRATPSAELEDAPARTRRAATGALVLSAVVLLLGGLTANLGAAGACLGFPLCSGRVWPTDGGLARLQWTHRLLSYALFLHLVGLSVTAYRRRLPAHLRHTVVTSLTVAISQVTIGAAMVLTDLMPAWRALHAATGIALWVVLVALVCQVQPRAQAV